MKKNDDMKKTTIIHYLLFVSLFFPLTATAQVDTLEVTPPAEEPSTVPAFTPTFDDPWLDLPQTSSLNDYADRGLRVELDIPFGYGNNTYIGHSGDPYKNFDWDLGAQLIFHFPLNHRWDISGGAGFRFRWYHFPNSIHFDTTTLLISGHTPTDWRSYSCLIVTRSIYVPLRIAIVTNRMTDIYLGFNLAYTLSNSFYYDQMGADDESHPVADLNMNNIEAIRKFRAEVAVGMSWPLWWIFSGGWELYYTLTPTFDTGIAGTPSIHEFGLRLTL